MQVFFSTSISESRILLEGQEASHCTKVLRKKAGDQLYVIDGQGHFYTTTFVNATRNQVELEIVKKEYRERSLNLPHLAIGLIKNTTRIEWMIEKLTEIGVASITLLITARTERKIIKTERLQKVMISAMKQSMNLHMPILNDPIPFKNYIEEEQSGDLFIASYAQKNPFLYQMVNKPTVRTILIGPEGDFTEQEIILAKDKGFQSVNLGTTRLRTETAAIVACTMLNQQS